MLKFNPKSVVIFACGVILFFLILQVETNSVSRRGYGKPCNKTFRCTSQLWLACDQDSNTCQCAKPDEMIYDNAKQKCVAMIGGRCKYRFDEDEIPTSLWYEKAECVQNAVCGPSGLCSCPDGYFEDETLHHCYQSKDHGLSCTNSIECNKDKLLSCLDGLCQCDPDKAIYNTNPFSAYNYQGYTTEIPGNLCVGRVGSHCNDYEEGKKAHCIQNAVCKTAIANPNNFPLYSGTCRCGNDYAETSDQLCGLGYDKNCGHELFCSDQLQCTGRLEHYSDYSRPNTMRFSCQCSHPTYQNFDSSVGKCRGNFGSPCNPHDLKTCSEGSVCNERDNIFQCECDEGYVENNYGQCEIAFGQRCNEKTTHCDSKANLQCKRSKCSCNNDIDIYEHNRRQCSRPVGIRCNRDDECVSNSFCLTSNYNLLERCTCKMGYSVTKNHTCISEDLITSNESNEIDVIISSVITNEGSGLQATVESEDF